jgi:RNA polymerase sigma-70 factor (ECF subfamily)
MHFMTHLKALSGNNPPQDLHKHKPGPDKQAENQSTAMWLERRITTLPERQREVLVLSTLKGLRMKDIAKVMSLPENTVKTHLRRARLALAESLADRENRPETRREPQQTPHPGDSPRGSQ